jgi:hypothetical protein
MTDSLRHGLKGGENTALLTMLTKPDTVAVLVEGAADISAYAPHFQAPPADMVKVNRGRDWVIDATCRLRGEQRTFVGIIDADDDCPLNRRPQHSGLFTTDLRDLESMMFFGGAGEQVLAQILDPTQVSEFVTARGFDLVHWVTEQVAFTGAVRLANTNNGAALCFRRVDVADYVDRTKIRFLRRKYLAELVRLSPLGPNPSDWAARAENILSRYKGREKLLVHGHDLTTFLSALTTGRFGTGTAYDREAVELALRSAYTRQAFRQTRLWQDLVAWEKESGIAFLRRS